MGVLGLTPFLQKAFPQVVKQIPDRLRGFAGKKIVIDGTLITQRLHFAQVPHDYRHVLGWYKLVKELQDSDVSAICVFDGNERSAAKARESERRREAKKLAVARGSIELDRVKRLQKLVDVLDRFKKLDILQKGRVSELLREISSETNLPLPLESFVHKDEASKPTKDKLAPPVPDFAPDELVVLELSSDRPSPPSEEPDSAKKVIEPSAVPSQASQEGSPKVTCTPNDPIIEPHTPPSSPTMPPTKPKTVSLPPPIMDQILPSPQASTPRDKFSKPTSQSKELEPASSARPVPSSPSTRPSTTPSPKSPPSSPLERPFPILPIPEAGTSEACPVTADIDVPSTLVSLYSDFRDSVRKLASLTPVPPGTLQSADPAEQEEAHVEFSMSKSQIRLAADEAKLWEKLAAFSFDVPEEQSHEETLAKLSFRSNVMSQSYERRNNPPTAQTYDESKELLRTMGVACIDTTGTYEAEALASSLVLNGFADYVASEDTDVVVYEAPLIRNLTNRGSPLVMLSGPEIRSALELDRSSFIDFALLLGTDFSQRIKNVGPVRALKFIRQHKSIERVIEIEKKYTPRVPPPAYLAEVELARLVFQTLPPVPDAKFLEQGKDDEGLLVVLQRFGLGKLLMGEEEWEFEDALQGNYFSDDPSA